jgi:hypothetical protein
MMTLKRTKKITRNAVDNKNLPIFYCTVCQHTFTSGRYFFTTNDPQIDGNGFLHCCKECIKKFYDQYFELYKSAERSLYEMCKKIDYCFSSDAAAIAINQAIGVEGRHMKSDVVGYYFSKIKTTSFKNGKSATGKFADSDRFKFDSDMINIPEEKEYNETEEDRLKRLKTKWSGNYDLWEYNFLEEEMTSLLNSYEINDYGMFAIAKDICMLQLMILKERNNGGNAISLIEARQKLFTNAKLNPVQSSGIDENDIVSFGTLIKRMENERPIPKALDSGIKTYIDTFMIGHLARMEGISNTLTEKMDKELEDYTINFDEVNIKEDNDEE